MLLSSKNPSKKDTNQQCVSLRSLRFLLTVTQTEGNGAFVVLLFFLEADYNDEGYGTEE